MAHVDSQRAPELDALLRSSGTWDDVLEAARAQTAAVSAADGIFQMTTEIAVFVCRPLRLDMEAACVGARRAGWKPPSRHASSPRVRRLLGEETEIRADDDAIGGDPVVGSGNSGSLQRSASSVPSTEPAELSQGGPYAE
jgi:hypothetical protein